MAHRADLLRLRGEWRQALDERDAYDASRWEASGPGAAAYAIGELHRSASRGSREAYRQASEH
jgi:hypothetical protein